MQVMLSFVGRNSARQEHYTDNDRVVDPFPQELSGE